MAKRSAGLLMYRRSEAGGLEVLLVHPGGPFWAKKDLGAWTIPKGEPEAEEELLVAAKREFTEETGFAVGEDGWVDLGSVTQVGGKVVSAWAFAGDCDPGGLVSNTCEIEWPPRSRRRLKIPEVDRGAWFSIAEARRRILPSQVVFVERLVEAVDR